MVGTETRLLSLRLDSGGRPAGPRGPGGPGGTARSSAGLTSDGRRASLGDARGDRAPSRPRPRSVAIVANECQTWRRPGRAGAPWSIGGVRDPASGLLGGLRQERVELAGLLGLGGLLALRCEGVELPFLLVLA